MPKIDEIITFWFGENPNNPLANSKQWWKKDPALDQLIRKRFGEDLKKTIAGEYETWQENAQGALALIILIDQFSRNIYRDTPEAFAYDTLALEICLKAIEQGLDQELPPVQRWFFYLPLMHSESKEMHKKSLQLYQQLAENASEELRSALQGAYNFAQQHAEIVFRFGRYPHRNALLGRESTVEEIEFLKQPNSSF